MKKEILKYLGLALGVIALVMFINFITSTRPFNTAQPSNELDGVTQKMYDRLRQLGVPVNQVKVSEEVPEEIEIIIQEQGDEGLSSSDNLWNKFIAKRESELTKRNYGTDIGSYRIIINTNGKTISDNTTYINPGKPSQNLTPISPSEVQLDQTQNILDDNFDPMDLKILSIEVLPKYTDQWNSKYIILNMSTGIDSHTEAEPGVTNFIHSIYRQINTINIKFGTRIAIVRAKIYDARGNLLVDYLEDIDLRFQMWHEAADFQGGWYPKPAFTEEELENAMTQEPTLPPAPTIDVRSPTPTVTERPLIDSGTYPYP